jgi:hypothetical protein
MVLEATLAGICSTRNIGAGGASASASVRASGWDAPEQAPAPAGTDDWRSDRSRLPALHEVVRVVGIGHLVIWYRRGRGRVLEQAFGGR